MSSEKAQSNLSSKFLSIENDEFEDSQTTEQKLNLPHFVSQTKEKIKSDFIISCSDFVKNRYNQHTNSDPTNSRRIKASNF